MTFVLLALLCVYVLSAAAVCTHEDRCPAPYGDAGCYCAEIRALARLQSRCMFEAEFQLVEAAIALHPELVLAENPSPLMSVDRDCCRMRIYVKLRKSRRRPAEIAEFADTPGEAAARLVRNLDIWAKVLK